jgi:uncharacterized membrane protein YjgN (DUF898 family)
MNFCIQCGRELVPGSNCACLVHQPATLKFSCDATGSALLGLYLKTLLLSIVTLGIYSFWGRAEIRRYLYNSTLAGDDRFAGHGTGRELLLGWLKAAGLICGFYTIYFGLILASKTYGPLLGALFFYLLLLAIAPYVIVGVLRYRLSRTSLRGIHFGCRADAREFGKIYYKNLILTILTLGLYSPWFVSNIRAFLAPNCWYGDQPFDYDGQGNDLFRSWLLFMLLLLPTLYLVAFWYAAKQERYVVGHTTWRLARMNSTLRGRDILWLMLSNLALIVCTLGIGLPWARLRTVRLHCRTTTVENFTGFEPVRQRTMAATATGESIGSLLEVDSDVGGGFGL